MSPFTITVHNSLPIERKAEAVTIGVPFVRGELKDAAEIRVKDAGGANVPCQSRAQSLWGDGSVRWALVHFIGDLAADGKTPFRVAADGSAPARAAHVLQISNETTRVGVNTGVLRFAIDSADFRGIEKARIPTRKGDGWVWANLPLETGSLYMKDAEGKRYTALWGKTRNVTIIDEGPVVFTASLEGELADDKGNAILEYDLWLRAFAGQATIRASTVRNPRATHRRVLGQWPLGLGGSVYFKEIGWAMKPAQDGVPFVTLHAGGLPHHPLADDAALRRANPAGEVYRGPFTKSAALVQDSSGGENWFHRGHVNRDWRVPLSYRGWKAFVDGKAIRQGDRADAWIGLEDSRIGLAMGVRHSWQNFPKAVRASKDPDGKGQIALALWPEEFDDVHELQGGEQKTHELVFHFYRGDAWPGVAVPYSQWPETAIAMCRALNPPAAFAEGARYAGSKAFDYLALYDEQRQPHYERVNEGSVLAEPANLFTQREFVDEFGWRSFGDVLADCEVNGRVLSHYNLEYYMGYAMLMQAVRTADARADLARLWWGLGEAALRHEADIDVYHTDEDRHTGGAYCRGKHHHTDHAYEAGRATHRAYEEDGMQGDLAWYGERGGGPESQHMNTRGMLTYAWMAGYPPAVKVARAMADLIAYKVTSGNFAQTGGFFRDSGHSVQILIEGYHITRDRKYLDVAAQVIDAGHLDRQPWFGGFPVATKDKKGGHPSGDMLLWGGSIFLKEIARYIEIHEAEGWPVNERAMSAILTAVEYFNRYGWDEALGRFAHTVKEDGGQFRYQEPWWDLKVLEMVAWACRWQKDATARQLWLARARRNFHVAPRLLAPDPARPIYHQCKCSSVAAQNGPGFLVIEGML